MSVTVVEVSIVSADRAITLVVVVRVRETLASAEQSTNQEISGERSTNGPDTLEDITIKSDGVGRKSSSKLRRHVIKGTESRDGLLDGSNTTYR